jgi:predicted hydrocarbon binding protein
MKIENRSGDPVAEFKIMDAYMRWAILAAEEVAGKQGLNVVLREAGLERFIEEYPRDEMTARGITFGDYASFNAGLQNFFGRAAKSMVLRIGRISAKHGIDRQSAVFGVAALVAAKLLPFPVQAKMGLEAMRDGFIKVSEQVGQKMIIKVEDRGDRLAYIDHNCANCAGKKADAPMCWIHFGAIQEGLRWLTGKEADSKQTECRALGAAACVWEVSKTPKE